MTGRLGFSSPLLPSQRGPGGRSGSGPLPPGTEPGSPARSFSEAPELAVEPWPSNLLSPPDRTGPDRVGRAITAAVYPVPPTRAAGVAGAGRGATPGRGGRRAEGEARRRRCRLRRGCDGRRGLEFPRAIASTRKGLGPRPRICSRWRCSRNVHSRTNALIIRDQKDAMAFFRTTLSLVPLRNSKR